MSAYDSIYADARAWIKSGTVDYVLPQLYWPRGHKLADYETLAAWWSNEVKGTDVQLYIGEGLYRVGAKDDRAWTKPGELAAQIGVNRDHKQVKGDVYFSATNLLANPLGSVDRVVKAYYARPALLPLMKARGGAAPAPPAGVKAAGSQVSWTPSQGARAYAVYQVPKSGKDCHGTDARNLVAIVTSPSFAAKSEGTYLVTALDRLQHESKAAKVTVEAV